MDRLPPLLGKAGRCAARIASHDSGGSDSIAKLRLISRNFGLFSARPWLAPGGGGRRASSSAAAAAGAAVAGLRASNTR
jgi:hypothetical protein